MAGVGWRWREREYCWFGWGAGAWAGSTGVPGWLRAESTEIGMSEGKRSAAGTVTASKNCHLHRVAVIWMVFHSRCKYCVIRILQRHFSAFFERNHPPRLGGRRQ